jgi:hypothetical protein
VPSTFDRSNWCFVQGFFEVSVTTFTVGRVVEAGDSEPFDIARRFLALHVLLDFGRVVSVVVNSISTQDNQVAVPWSETVVTLDHAKNVTSAILTAMKSAAFNLVDCWLQLACTGGTDHVFSTGRLGLFLLVFGT